MEQEPKANIQLPIISQETVSKLEEDLGLNITGSTRSVLEGITKERQITPYERLGQMTEDFASDIVEANPKFAEALLKGIREGIHLGSVEEVRTDVIRGMALVFNAFHIQSNYDLTSKIGEIKDDESLKRVNDIVYEGLGKSKRMDPIESALSTPKISDVQINLRELISKTTYYQMFHKSQFKAGAFAMYGVLSEFKDRLFAKQQNSPASQPPPAI